MIYHYLEARGIDFFKMGVQQFVTGDGIQVDLWQDFPLFPKIYLIVWFSLSGINSSMLFKLMMSYKA